MTDDNFNKLISESTATPEAAFGLIDKLLDVAKPEAVYSEPVETGNVTVITASEYAGGMGAGYGGGATGGGGGGGSILSRPVAAIIVEDDRVRVEPIVDVTKISIAFFTTLGAMWMAWGRMRKASQ